MDVTGFYAAAAALCFTLLGFWWVVVQFRHTELTRDNGPRWFAFLVSLYFIVPGLVSLASLLQSGGLLWRVAFGVAGLAAIAAILIVSIDLGSRAGILHTIARTSWVGLPLFAVMTVIAFNPDIARSGLGLEPLQVEGLDLVLILLVGILFAWVLLVEPLTAAEEGNVDVAGGGLMRRPKEGAAGVEQAVLDADRDGR